MHVALLHLVPLKPLETKARQVAGSGADAAEGHLRHAFHWVGCDEGAALVHVLGQTHVSERGVVGASHDLKEVVVLSEVLCRVMGILERTDLHLRFQK